MRLVRAITNVCFGLGLLACGASSERSSGDGQAGSAGGGTRGGGEAGAQARGGSGEAAGAGLAGGPGGGAGTAGGGTGGAGAAGGGAGGAGGPPNIRADYSALLACDVPDPCEGVMVGGGSCAVLTTDAAVCVLTALRERRIGRYGAARTNCSSSGTTTSGSLLVVRPDGRASRVSYLTTSDFESFMTSDCALADASYFDACLDTLTAADAGPPSEDCMLLIDGVTDCVEGPPRCE